MTSTYPCLWFDRQAEEAARFYTGIFPNSSIDEIMRTAVDTPAAKSGEVLWVSFTLDRRRFSGMNGGPQCTFTQAVSFVIECADQAEVDRYWDALTAEGGREVACGWCTDKYGLSWQVVPRRMLELLNGTDRVAAEHAMRAMMEMVKIDIALIEAAVAG